MNSETNIHLHNLSLILILSLVILRNEGSSVVSKMFLTTQKNYRTCLCRYAGDEWV